MVKNQNCLNSLKKSPAFHIRSLPNVNLLKLFIRQYLLLISLNQTFLRISSPCAIAFPFLASEAGLTL